MKIYLDTKDLIEIIENSNPFTYSEFLIKMHSKNHKIILSNIHITEISEPLIHKSKKTNIIQVINKIEEIPHIFVNFVNLTRLELFEAYKAYKNVKEYQTINPFVKRFTDSIELEKKFPLDKYLIYSLAEIVWNLYNEGSLMGFNEHADNFKYIFKIERANKNKPSLKKGFEKTIRRHLNLYKLRIPTQEIPSFTKWIYENPNRCPSIRLSYEVFNKMAKNVGYNPKNSDIEDLVHLQCLPYADLMTVDRTFLSYILQATKSIKIDYDRKFVKSVKEINF